MSVRERKAGRQFTSLRKQRGTDRKGPWTAWEPTHCDLFLPSRPPHLKFPAPPQIVPPAGDRIFNTRGFGENTSYSNHSNQPVPSFPDLLWREVPGRPHKAQCSRVFCCNVQTLCLSKMVNHSMALLIMQETLGWYDIKYKYMFSTGIFRNMVLSDIRLLILLDT